jgi:hypothetical protein
MCIFVFCLIVVPLPRVKTHQQLNYVIIMISHTHSSLPSFVEKLACSVTFSKIEFRKSLVTDINTQTHRTRIILQGYFSSDWKRGLAKGCIPLLWGSETSLLCRCCSVTRAGPNRFRTPHESETCDIHTALDTFVCLSTSRWNDIISLHLFATRWNCFFVSS